MSDPVPSLRSIGGDPGFEPEDERELREVFDTMTRDFDRVMIFGVRRSASASGWPTTGVWCRHFCKVPRRVSWLEFLGALALHLFKLQGDTSGDEA